MILNTDHLKRCISTLESSLTMYRSAAPESIDQEVFRNAIVKGYELAQETSFKLLKRALKDFGHGGKKLETTPIKEILRLAATHGLITLEEVERWFAYTGTTAVTPPMIMVKVSPKKPWSCYPASSPTRRCWKSPCATDSTMRHDRAMSRPATVPLNLPKPYLEQVVALLRIHAPQAEVWAYGSRVSGGGHAASDLDLVLRNPANPDTETPGLFDLKEAFIESDLPIRVDVMDWARIPESFHREIERAHVVIQAGS